MYTSLRWDAIPLLLNTVVLMTWLIIVYRPWLVHVKGEPMRNSTLLALSSEREERIAVEDECLFIKSDKTEIAKVGQVKQ